MPLDAVVWYVAFVVSVTAHEAAHAVVAYVGGDSTAYSAGQVSLNPAPHMRREPFGMIVMPLLSAFSMGWPLGWASTPYDPMWEQRHPRRAAWMAAAGPGANLAIALAALLLLWGGLQAGVFSVPEQVFQSRGRFSGFVAADTLLVYNVGRFLSMLLLLNLILMLFNLIPFPPLDGAAVITLLFDQDTGLRLKETLANPAFAIGGLLAAWYLFGYVVSPLWDFAVWAVLGW